jgi:mediator of RNA polymerase II transcription subunit 12
MISLNADTTRLSALLRLTSTHCETIFLTATHAQQAAMIGALNALVILPFLELYPSITEHIFDVAVVLSDHLSDDVRNHFSRHESMRSTNDTRCQFVLGVAAPIGGWLVLTKPVNLPLNTHVVSQPSTPLASPYHSPQLASAGPSTPQQRYFNQQLQQRQQLQQAQQAQQMRSYPQYPQQSMPQNRGLPAQLQRTPSGQPPQSSLQQMQHMQQVQALAQQRATQPSPVHSQRPTPAVSQSSAAGGPVGGNASLNKSHTGPAKNNNQQREIRHFPFVQPRWEVLAESSGNPNLNETAISLSLFGARKV